MNSDKIGTFIASCRKEKCLTQVQLANKLNITNRAVSKWETGKSIPDASIMLELCEILGITVNELLSGERSNTMEDYKAKAEKNLLELQEKKERAKKDLLYCELIWLAVELIVLAPIHFVINYYFPDNNGTGVGLMCIIVGIIVFSVYFIRHYEIKLK